MAQGKDPNTTMEYVKNWAHANLMSVLDENLPDYWLNCYAPQKYWDIYDEVEDDADTIFSITEYNQILGSLVLKEYGFNSLEYLQNDMT